MREAYIFRMCRKAHRGIPGDDKKWLENIIALIGPGGHFTAEESTVEALHSGEWYMSDTGVHESYERWAGAGKPLLINEMRDKIDAMLSACECVPLPDDVERELSILQKKAGQCVQNQ